MPCSNSRSSLEPRCRVRQLQLRLCAAAIVAAGLASADASAGLLDKLLAPAVGTKPGYSEGKKTYDEDTLKPDELSKCVITAHDFDQRTAHNPVDTEALEKERAQLSKTGQELKAAAEASAKEPLPKEEADKLKARIADYQKAADDFNTRKNAALLDDKAYRTAKNKLLAEYQDFCVGKRFWKSDLEIIRPNLPFDISGILDGKK